MNAHRTQMRALDCLELEFRMAVSLHVCVQGINLEIKPGSSSLSPFPVISHELMKKNS